MVPDGRGYVTRSCWLNKADTIHVFGPIGFAVLPDVSPTLLPPFTDAGHTWTSKGQSLRPIRVTTSSRAFVRDADAPVGPLGLEFLGRDSWGSSLIKLEVRATTIAGATNYFIDAGQTLEFLADGAVVKAWLPPNAYRVYNTKLEEEQPQPTREGLVFDQLVGVGIAETPDAIGNIEARYTQTVQVDENRDGVVLIPPYADRVFVYQVGSDLPVDMRWVIGNPFLGASLDVGEIVWDATGNPVREHLRRPQATHVSIAAVTETRVFTFVWMIKP